MDSIEQMGWKLRFRFRTIKKRKRDAKGKARGFYEGDYVYLRVTDPQGRQRDIYVGRTESGLSAPKAKGRKSAPASSSSPGSREGRKQGQKALEYDSEEDVGEIDMRNVGRIEGQTPFARASWPKLKRR